MSASNVPDWHVHKKKQSGSEHQFKKDPNRPVNCQYCAGSMSLKSCKTYKQKLFKFAYFCNTFWFQCYTLIVISANAALHTRLPTGSTSCQTLNIPKGPLQGPWQFKPTHLKPLVPQCWCSSPFSQQGVERSQTELVMRSSVVWQHQTLRCWSTAGHFD